MGKEHIQTRVPSKLYQQIEEYEEEGAYMNQAEAIRHLLRAGLEAEQNQHVTVAHSIVGRLLGPALGLMAGILLTILITGV